MKQIIKNWLDNNVFYYIDKFLKRPNIDNGLIEVSAKQIIKAKDYVYKVLGDTGKRIIKEDGDFTNFMPIGEQQNNPFEKMICVSENGTANPIECNFNFFIKQEKDGQADEETRELLKIFRYFGLIKDDKCLIDSEYIAVGAGTTRRGTSYTAVANFIRHNGLVGKGSWHNYSTWNEMYYKSDGVWINGNKVSQELLDRGRKFVEFVDITYEWVTPNNFNSAVKRGCFGTSCFAWLYPDNNDIYRKVNFAKNHAITKFKKSEQDHQKIGDSYIPFIKKLSLDYDLGYGMLFSFRVKKPLNIFNEEEIKRLRDRGLEYILLVNKYEQYDPGVYKLGETLEKAELKVILDNGVTKLANEGKLTGISADDFKKLFT